MFYALTLPSNEELSKQEGALLSAQTWSKILASINAIQQTCVIVICVLYPFSAKFAQKNIM